MKPQPAPAVPGDTPWQRLGNALDMVLAVPKEAILKEEARLKRMRQRKRTRKRDAQS
jgi:hypothetical protein